MGGKADGTGHALTVDSSSPFVFTACGAFLDALGTPRPACVMAIRPREPDCLLFCVVRGEGVVGFKGHTVRYSVESSPPLASDPKPEPFRQLHLKCDAGRGVLLDLVRAAIEQHRTRCTAPRGCPGVGVMHHTWDDASECWDSGKLTPHRPLATLFLPGRVAEDALDDLRSYTCPETLGRYAELHIAPVRAYMLHGPPGAGKTALVHCLASATGHNLATLSFEECTSSEDVTRALHNLPPRTFLCINDVDCLFDGRSARPSRNGGVGFAAVLAALDGAFGAGHARDSPLTVFMTTNRLEALDPALRRRVDYSVEFGYATKEQCRAMFEAFHPGHPGFQALWSAIRRHQFSMSVLQKFLVRTLHGNADPLDCLPAFGDLMQCTYSRGPPSDRSMFS